MKLTVIEAPNKIVFKPDETITVFLAGGIQKCPDWQNDVIDHLAELCANDTEYPNWTLRVLNPRRKNFPIIDDSNKFEIDRQINWEYDVINIHTDIFSMFFCNSESDQPICMYELGYQIGKDKLPIIVSIEPGYKREHDVITQTKLALNFPEPRVNYDIDVDFRFQHMHARCIFDKVCDMIKQSKMCKIYTHDQTIHDMPNDKISDLVFAGQKLIKNSVFCNENKTSCVGHNGYEIEKIIRNAYKLGRATAFSSTDDEVNTDIEKTECAFPPIIYRVGKAELIICGKCHMTSHITRAVDYCPHCGNRIDWLNAKYAEN